MQDSNDILVYGLKRQISISLKNLMYMKDKDLYIGDLFWFSIHDIRSGYILLYPSINTGFANYVFFLREVIDPFDGTTYFPGDVKLIRHVGHVLNSIPKLSDKELGRYLPFYILRKDEILKELDQLKRSLNQTQNERN
jgi:hypothetical protein